MRKYINRIADSMLLDALDSKGAVLVQGPRWCGKYTTALRIAKSAINLEDPLRGVYYQQMAKLNPYNLLEGDTPHLIDEWQLAPNLWDAVRIEVDNRGEFGQFILTGSSVPPPDAPVFHSGTGRFRKLTMEPMTLYESGESNGSVSLEALFNGNDNVSGMCDLSLEKIAFLICRGGWPEAMGRSDKAALSQATDFFEFTIETDISKVDGIARNPDRVRKFMKSYARAVSTETNKKQILKDLTEVEDDTLDLKTIDSYIAALKNLFVIRELEAWNPDIRSKIAIRTTPTRHYIDPSVATAALRIGPQDLINDLESFGYFFESMCVRDLRVYAQALDADLFHYRDAKNLEADAVIHRRNGQWGAIEIKLGMDKVDEAASNLLKLKDRVDCNKMKEPSFLMYLTGTFNYAYKRPDGVLVVPIGCLRP